MMQKTALDIIRYISDEVEDKHIPIAVMLSDVQMMHFKIRNVIGDISMVKSMDPEFIESLWKIGKIDEIIASNIHDLDEDEQEMLMSYLESMESHARQHLRESFNTKKSRKKSMLKLEIFKDLHVNSHIH